MKSEHAVVDEALVQRVCSEFLEMPGLRLTCQQAQRLCGLDESTALQVLEFLVEAKFLCRNGHGLYTRLTDGHVSVPQVPLVPRVLPVPLVPRVAPRMAKAQIDAGRRGRREAV
jgi:hypothetical protein